MQSYTGSLRSELSFSWEGTCRRPKAFIPGAKILFWKQSTIYASFRQRGPENQDARKKIHGGGQNLKDHWLLA